MNFSSRLAHEEERTVTLDGLHHVILKVPDLAACERFMTDFGLIPAHGESTRLYLRGAGMEPYCYVAELSESPAFEALAFRVNSIEALREAERIPGAQPMKALDRPGGGYSVTLRDPDGLRIDLVAGIDTVAPLPVRAPLTLNHGTVKTRFGARQHQPAPGPATVLRIGHAGLIVSDFRRSLAWYTETLGLIPSDILYIGDRSRQVAAFMRADRGEEWVDHHALVIFGGQAVKFQHASFETQDFDAQQLGHRWMLTSSS